MQITLTTFLKPFETTNFNPNGFSSPPSKPQSAANQTSITTFLSANNHKPTNYLTTLCQGADYKIQLIPHLLMDEAHSLYLKFTTHPLELFFFQGERIQTLVFFNHLHSLLIQVFENSLDSMPLDSAPSASESLPEELPDSESANNPT
jgi:hypothetical protein